MDDQQSSELLVSKDKSRFVINPSKTGFFLNQTCRMYKTSVPTSQRTVWVDCKNQSISDCCLGTWSLSWRLCQRAEVLNVKADGTCKYHRTLDVQNYSLNPRNRGFEKPLVAQPFESFPTFYKTRIFVTLLTRSPLLTSSWARWNRSTPSHSLPTKFNRMGLLGLA
jgi:hypothetical protein